MDAAGEIAKDTIWQIRKPMTFSIRATSMGRYDEFGDTRLREILGNYE